MPSWASENLPGHCTTLCPYVLIGINVDDLGVIVSMQKMCTCIHGKDSRALAKLASASHDENYLDA